jgi:hypothetical protein
MIACIISVSSYYNYGKIRMKVMYKLIAGSFLVLLSLSTAQAGIIAQYDVQTYNGGTAALFTVSENNGDITATLIGSLSNINYTGSIDLQLDDWRDSYNYKVEGGANNGGVNADFFVDIA